MTDQALEPRSFQELTSEPDAIEPFDAVDSRALIHRVRWHTGLSQAEFARIYHIDAGHLRELESGLAAPDSVMVAYLTVIDREPDVVRAALTTC